jgi:triosephosphate isomerase
MNKTLSEGKEYLKLLQKRLPEITHSDWEMILAPSCTALSSVFGWIQESALPIALAAQNFHFETEGAYTGEVSARMLREVGCRYVMIGHSERRIHFQEKDETIACKVAAAQLSGLLPILCVGENAAERNAGKTSSVIKRQIRKGFDLGPASRRAFTEEPGMLDLSDCIVAYEPVWAVGTGETPAAQEVESVHLTIVNCLKSAGVTPEGMPRILYGGSVNEKNVGFFMREPHIDGVLAGGASLSVETFVRIIETGLYAREER